MHGEQSAAEAPAKVRDPLLDFVADVSGSDYLQVEEDLGEGFVRLNTAEAERRQARHDIRHVEDIIIEMLRNSRDAGAQHIFIASSKEDHLRTITIIDDGEGVPDKLGNRIFEARVTSKLTSILEDEWGVHGRGMALYSITQNVKKIVLCAGGAGRGTAFCLRIDTQTLRERADQSTWPKIERAEDGTLHCVSGPRNLLRHIAEFTLAHPDLKVHVGSPNEILATLRVFGEGCSDGSSLPSGDKSNVESSDIENSLPHCLRPACAVDATQLAACAASLGLDVSTRSAYRIDNDEIDPLPDVSTLLTQNLPREHADLDLSTDLRGLKIDNQDMNEFVQQIEHAFDDLAEKYYIAPSAELRVAVKKNTLTVRIDFEKEY